MEKDQATDVWGFVISMLNDATDFGEFVEELDGEDITQLTPAEWLEMFIQWKRGDSQPEEPPVAETEDLCQPRSIQLQLLRAQ